MVATPHPPLNDVMTERPTELLHMDLVGPARVRSVGGKCYVLVVVDDYSHYAWVFFLEDKSELYPHRVYRLKRALYGLKQGPRAWYGRLRGFLLSRGFVMGTVDRTLFLLKHGNDLLIVQIYVDDIVFGGSSNNLVAKFADEMSREFEMSMMGELQYFLGLQIKQVKDGTFVHQIKYTKDMLRKFQMQDVKPMSIPMGSTTTLDADEDGEPVDQ
jgi:hypothetical protein